MPYYTGDRWHRSRTLRVYTRGDPGLFSFLKKTVRAVGGIVKSPLGGLAMSLIPGGGWIKTGLDIARSGFGGMGMAGGPQPEPGGYEAGGTPGMLAHAHATGRMRRPYRRRYRRSRRY